MIIKRTLKQFYNINKNDVNLTQYIIKNNFIKLGPNQSIISDFKSFKISPVDCKSFSEFYYKKSSIGEDNWKMILNKTSGQLWIIIEYSN
jgi:hypothetical protein